MQLKQWKKLGKFQPIMIKSGFDLCGTHRVWIKMNRWQSMMICPVRFVMNVDWFMQLGLICLHGYT